MIASRRGFLGGSLLGALATGLGFGKTVAASPAPAPVPEPAHLRLRTELRPLFNTSAGDPRNDPLWLGWDGGRPLLDLGNPEPMLRCSARTQAVTVLRVGDGWWCDVSGVFVGDGTDLARLCPPGGALLPREVGTLGFPEEDLPLLLPGAVGDSCSRGTAFDLQGPGEPRTPCGTLRLLICSHWPTSPVTYWLLQAPVRVDWDPAEFMQRSRFLSAAIRTAPETDPDQDRIEAAASLRDYCERAWRLQPGPRYGEPAAFRAVAGNPLPLLLLAGQDFSGNDPADRVPRSGSLPAYVPVG